MTLTWSPSSCCDTRIAGCGCTNGWRGGHQPRPNSSGALLRARMHAYECHASALPTCMCPKKLSARLRACGTNVWIQPSAALQQRHRADATSDDGPDARTVTKTVELAPKAHVVAWQSLGGPAREARKKFCERESRPSCVAKLLLEKLDLGRRIG